MGICAEAFQSSGKTQPPKQRAPLCAFAHSLSSASLCPSRGTSVFFDCFRKPSALMGQQERRGLSAYNCLRVSCETSAKLNA